MTIVPENIKYMRISPGVPRGWGVKRLHGVLDDGNFQGFRWLYFFGNFDKASIIYTAACNPLPACN